MSDPIHINLLHDTPAEQQTRRLLESILATYDLRPFLFTSAITIDETARPHSHPVLTLNTEHAGDEVRLLAELIHEQFHWFEEDRPAIRDAVIETTRELYPAVPSDPVEGSGSEYSTRLHLLVCNLEYSALRLLLGNTRAESVIRDLADHHYKWVYRTVLRDSMRITLLMADFWPDGLPDPLYT
jgi:hypothetical protein